MKAFLKFELTALVLVIIFYAVLLAPTELYAYDTDDEDIHDIQIMLTLKNLYTGPIDGIAGPETKKAIQLYKKQIGWPITDQISDQLIERLREEAEEAKLISPNTNPEPEQPNSFSNEEKLAALTQELNKTKEDLKNTNERLETIRTVMSEQFIANFRDTVAIIGVGIGIWATLAGSFFVWGFSNLQETIKKRVKIESELAQKNIVNDCKFKIYIHLSNAFYIYYREFFDNYSHPAFKSGTNLAIHFAEGALEVAKDITPNNPIMLKTAELHKIYHLTSQNIQEPECRKQDTIDFVSDQIGFVNSLIRSENAIERSRGLEGKETIAWTLIITGNEREKEYGNKILKEVLEHDDLPLSSQTEINENYEKLNKGKKRKNSHHSPGPGIAKT